MWITCAQKLGANSSRSKVRPNFYLEDLTIFYIFALEHLGLEHCYS